MLIPILNTRQSWTFAPAIIVIDDVRRRSAQILAKSLPSRRQLELASARGGPLSSWMSKAKAVKGQKVLMA